MAEAKSLIKLLREMPVKSGDAGKTTEVEQTFGDGRRVTLKIRKISNGFIICKDTFTPLIKNKPHSDITEADYDRQLKSAEFYVKEDPRKGAEEEDIFAEFLLDHDLIPTG